MADDPNLRLAAERTLLAWIRTGLSLMGFGFVVARFGLFLREMAAERDEAGPRPTGVSMWVGTTLVLLGVAAHLTSAGKHQQNMRRPPHGGTWPAPSSAGGLPGELIFSAL